MRRAALAALLVVVASLALLAHLPQIGASVRERQALYAAYAGAEEAVAHLKADPSWRSGARDVPMLNGSGSYSYEVTNNGAGAAPVSAANGVSVSPGSIYVLAGGQSAASDPIRIVRQVGVMLKSSSPFRFGIFGIDDVHLAHERVGEYDSSSAAGFPASVVSGPSELSVGTNGNGPGILSTAEAVPGAGWCGPGPIDAEAAIQGLFNSKQQLQEAAVMPAIAAPRGTSAPAPSPGPIAPGCYASLTLSDATATLTGPGAWYFVDGVTLRANGKLQIDATHGPVQIHFGGAWDSTGGTVTGPRVPRDLLLLGTPQATQVDVGGGSDSTMVVYAPSAHVVLHGNARFFGALLGRSIRADDARGTLYHDAHLATLNLFATLEVVSWQRL